MRADRGSDPQKKQTKATNKRPSNSNTPTMPIFCEKWLEGKAQNVYKSHHSLTELSSQRIKGKLQIFSETVVAGGGPYHLGGGGARRILDLGTYVSQGWRLTVSPLPLRMVMVSPLCGCGGAPGAPPPVGVSGLGPPQRVWVWVGVNEWENCTLLEASSKSEQLRLDPSETQTKAKNKRHANQSTSTMPILCEKWLRGQA